MPSTKICNRKYKSGIQIIFKKCSFNQPYELSQSLLLVPKWIKPTNLKFALFFSLIQIKNKVVNTIHMYDCCVYIFKNFMNKQNDLFQLGAACGNIYIRNENDCNLQRKVQVSVTYQHVEKGCSKRINKHGCDTQLNKSGNGSN